MMEEVIYLIFYKNICKCYNVPPHSTTIKKKEKENQGSPRHSKTKQINKYSSFFVPSLEYLYFDFVPNVQTFSPLLYYENIAMLIIARLIGSSTCSHIGSTGDSTVQKAMNKTG
jgi:hypothetical protein